MEKQIKQLIDENIANQDDWIPKEIQFDILRILPGKSLVRFKCVSKSWNSMISDPQFLDESHNKIILCDCKSIFLMNYEVSRAKAKRFESFDLPTKTKPEFVHVRASCNGILWISVNVEEHILWNPFTGERKIIPIEPHWSRLYSEPTHLGGINRWRAYGFGYDHITRDYKIVCIPKLLSKKSKPFIYSVTKNSCESLEENIPHYFAMGFHKIAGISMENGSVVYWPIWYRCDWALRNAGNQTSCVFNPNHFHGQLVDPHSLILGFNLADRTQFFIPQPPSVSYDSEKWNLMDFKGCICAMESDRAKGIIEMWLYKEETDRQKYWVKLMSISLAMFSNIGLSDFDPPIYISRDEEVLKSRIGRPFTSGGKTMFSANNSKGKRLRTIRVDGVEQWYEEITYNKTLTLIQS